MSAAEGDGSLTFTVTLSFASGAPVTVRYATENGSASAGSDYAAVSGTLTFPAASPAARTIGVAVTDDAVAEGAESFTMRLSEPHGATLADAVATGTISDDDARSVTVQPEELNVIEGASGTYTVVLGARPTAAVTVRITPAPELSVVPQELEFTPHDWATAQTVTVEAEHDPDAVADVAAAVVHEVQGGGYDGTSAPSVTVTVVEDDTQSLAIAGAGAAEGAGVLRFAVTLSLDSDAPVTVDYATGAAGDTAEAGTDYRSTSGTLRFPARSTAPRMIEVTVNDDTVDEPDERLTVTLSRPVNAILAGGGETATATGTITDDDALPQVRIAGASVSEGDGTVEFTVTLDRASARTVTVDYATVDDTARADADYTPVSGTLAFAAGQTSRTIAVPVIGDAVDEPDEQFTVTLSAAVDATVDPDGRTATGTINNDDDPPTLRIAGGSTSEGGGVLRVAVTLDADSGRTVTVDYATADGTATAAADYVPASGTLAFAPGTVAHTIAVAILADAVAEDTETFTVTLRDAHHAELAAAASTATGTITDDDTRGVRVQPTALTLYPASEAASYTLALASQPTDEVTVRMTKEPAAAAFAVTPAELRFTASSWEAAQTVTVSAEQGRGGGVQRANPPCGERRRLRGRAGTPGPRDHHRTAVVGTERVAGDRCRHDVSGLRSGHPSLCDHLRGRHDARGDRAGEQGGRPADPAARRSGRQSGIDREPGCSGHGGRRPRHRHRTQRHRRNGDLRRSLPPLELP